MAVQRAACGVACPPAKQKPRTSIGTPKGQPIAPPALLTRQRPGPRPPHLLHAPLSEMPPPRSTSRPAHKPIPLPKAPRRSRRPSLRRTAFRARRPPRRRPLQAHVAACGPAGSLRGRSRAACSPVGLSHAPPQGSRVLIPRRGPTELEGALPAGPGGRRAELCGAPERGPRREPSPGVFAVRLR